MLFLEHIKEFIFLHVNLTSSLQRIKSRWLPSPDSVALYA